MVYLEPVLTSMISFPVGHDCFQIVNLVISYLKFLMFLVTGSHPRVVVRGAAWRPWLVIIRGNG